MQGRKRRVPLVAESTAAFCQRKDWSRVIVGGKVTPPYPSSLATGCRDLGEREEI